MIIYNGKAKCSCGKRAKWKAEKRFQPVFACEEHKSRLNNLPNPTDDNGELTEADYQTWAR